MRVLFLLALVSLTALADNYPGRFSRFCDRTAAARTKRGLQCDDLAFFEFAPASGAGMPAACSTTAPTGAKGEALTFTRASAATCTKTATGGLASTGIADGDLVVMSNNQPRVEYDSAGTLGLLVEAGASQICTRTAELCNVVWTDVGTPACATDQAVGPFGTTTMDSITDNDAVAFEGRAQVIASTSATQFTAFCHVKWSSGAAASASITLAGTGSATGDCTGTRTGLSTTTSSIVECTSPAAYAGTLTAVTITIRVGTVVADQGTLLVEGCDVKPAAPYRTSHQPAVAAGTTRVIESPAFTIASTGPTACIAASVVWPSSSVGAVNFAALGSTGPVNMTLYRTSNTAAGYQINATISGPAVSAMGTTQHRALLYDNAGARAAFWDNGSVAAPANTMAGGATEVWIGRNVSGTPADGVVSRLQVDPNPLRCSAL